MVLQLVVAVPLAGMDRLEWRHAVIASAVLCLAIAVPLGLTANDPDTSPALLIPILATAFFVMLWLCGFLALRSVEGAVQPLLKPVPR